MSEKWLRNRFDARGDARLTATFLLALLQETAVVARVTTTFLLALSRKVRLRDGRPLFHG
jgi:hypothetical protein